MAMAKYRNYLILLHLLIVQVSCNPVSIHDIPMCEDIDTYLNAVEKAVSFTKTVDVDYNMAFGLLVVRANMMHVAQFLNITDDLKKRVQELEAVIEDTMSRENFPLTGPWRDELGITNLFSMSEVAPSYGKRIIPVEVKFSSVKEYVHEMVNEYVEARLSSYCIAEFEKLSRGNGSLKCPVDKKCLFYVIYGPDYGYGVNNRLLMMILLNSRGCYVFKPAEDEKIKQRLCSAIYSQAQYIAHNDYKAADILMESVCLCSSLGYTQFFSRKWFSKILDLQADYGCFESTQFPRHSKKNHHIDVICAKNTTYAEILKKRNCDPHLTIVSMAAMTVAARFTMQKCYGTLVK